MDSVTRCVDSVSLHVLPSHIAAWTVGWCVLNTRTSYWLLGTKTKRYRDCVTLRYVLHPFRKHDSVFV